MKVEWPRLCNVQLTLICSVAAFSIAACASAPIETRVAADKSLPLPQFIDKWFIGGTPSYIKGTEQVMFNEADVSMLYRPKHILTAYCEQNGGRLTLAVPSKVWPLTSVRYEINMLNPVEEQQRDRTALEAKYEKARVDGAVGTLECNDTSTQKSLWKVVIVPGNFKPENPNNTLESNRLTLWIKPVH